MQGVLLNTGVWSEDESKQQIIGKEKPTLIERKHGFEGTLGIRCGDSGGV